MEISIIIIIIIIIIVIIIVNYLSFCNLFVFSSFSFF